MKQSYRLFICLFMLLVDFQTQSLFAQAEVGKGQKSAAHLVQIGNTYLAVKRNTEAEQYLTKGTTLLRGSNSLWEAIGYESLGKLYKDQGNQVKAKKYFEKAIRVYGYLNSDDKIAILKGETGMSISGSIYGGIEIGAKGVKISVVKVIPLNNDDADVDFKVLYDKSYDVNPGYWTDETKTATLETVYDNYKLLESGGLRNKKNELLPMPIKIFVVMSSGLLTSARERNIENAFSKLRNALEKRIGNKVQAINDLEEGRYVGLGVIRRNLRDKSGIIDIGSGNVKGGHFLDQSDLSKYKHIKEFDGTETFAQKVKDFVSGSSNFQLFINAARDLLRPNGRIGYDVNVNLRDVRKQKKIYVVGGIAWVMAVYMKYKYANRIIVRFNLRDVQAFKDKILRDYRNNGGLSRPNSIEFRKLKGKTKDRATGDISFIESRFKKNKFTREWVVAGAFLLEAIVRKCCENDFNKDFFFHRQGYIGWITGCIVEYENSKKR